VTKPYKELEKALGYRFRDGTRLEQALTHRSYRYEHEDLAFDNQRLEFLGDAVLDFIVAAYVFRRFDEEQEGVLTSVRSQTTSGEALAEIARSIGLGEHLKMGKGEEQCGGRERPSNLADALEAVVGAAFLDGGIRAAQRIMKTLFQAKLDALSGDMWAGNPKGKLQEVCQRTWKSSPVYRMVLREGPAHATVFTVEVLLPDGTSGTGRGRSKQVAQREAARAALKMLSQETKQPSG
jgi:ribonuclease-3